MKRCVIALLAVLVLGIGACGSAVSEEADTYNRPGADVSDEEIQAYNPGTSGDVTDEASADTCTGPYGCVQYVDIAEGDTGNCGPWGCGDIQYVDIDEEETTPVVCNQATCEDGNTCTIDACVNNQCARAAKPDGQGCFIGGENGLCHSAECKNVTPEGGCYDANPCTIDQVVNGQCVNSSTVCADNNPCTADVCTATGNDSYKCDHVTLNSCNQCSKDSDCDDHNDCTGADNTLPDKCVAGSCVRNNKVNYTSCGAPGSFLYCLTGVCHQFNCDDHDACTVDSFELGVCKSVEIPNCNVIPPECVVATDCINGNTCLNAQCLAGDCVFSALDNCTPCAKDTDCGSGTTMCSDTASSVLYTFNGSCVNGECQRYWQHCQNGCDKGHCLGTCSANADCDDANPCSDDTCVDGECAHTQKDVCKTCTADSQCLDQDYCVDSTHLAVTSGECFSGLCEYVDLVECPLGCEANQCRECVADVNCDDGNFCTTDTCSQGQCQFVAKTSCQPDLTECEVDADCEGDAFGPYCMDISYQSGKKYCQSCKAFVFDPGMPDVGVADLGCGGDKPLMCLYFDYVASSGQTFSRAMCGECLTASDCDDGDACTVDSCYFPYSNGSYLYESQWECQNDVQSLCKTCTADSQCNDNNFVTYDHCVSGTCAFTSSCTTDAECGVLSCVAGKCGTDPTKVTCTITCPSGYDSVMVWHGQTQIEIVNGGLFTGSTSNDLCSWSPNVPVFDFNCMWGSGNLAVLECSSPPTITAHPDGGGKQTVKFNSIVCNK